MGKLTAKVGSVDHIYSIFDANFKRIDSLENKLRWLLKFIGVPTAHLGYEYIVDAILLMFEDKSYISNITKELYPRLANDFVTTKGAVERNIRYCASQCFNGKASHVNLDFRICIWGLLGKENKITNSNFLSGLYYFLLENMSK